MDYPHFTGKEIKIQELYSSEGLETVCTSRALGPSVPLGPGHPASEAELLSPSGAVKTSNLHSPGTTWCHVVLGATWAPLTLPGSSGSCNTGPPEGAPRTRFLRAGWRQVLGFINPRP